MTTKMKQRKRDVEALTLKKGKQKAQKTEENASISLLCKSILLIFLFYLLPKSTRIRISHCALRDMDRIFMSENKTAETWMKKCIRTQIMGIATEAKMQSKK